MKKSRLFNSAFSISLLTVLIGTILKILHLPGGEFFLILTFVVTVIYIITALSEIYSSNRISTNEKIMWTVSFIVVSFIAGLVYFLMGRPRMKRE